MMKKYSGIILATLLALAMFSSAVMACTSIPVGKLASADGSVFTTHTDDCGYCDPILYYVPAADHAAGSMRTVYSGQTFRSVGDGRYQDPIPVGEIPQIAHTFAYFAGSYGIMNENQVSFGETTTSGRSQLRNSAGMFNIIELSYIACERATTAREAVELMGALAEKYGYNDGGECLTVADPNEVWQFEILGPTPLADGAVWVAQRIPDNHVGVSANRVRVGEVNLEDKANFLGSSNIYTLAAERGWWTPGTTFLFYDAYGPKDSPYNWRREWRVLSLMAPSLNLDPYANRYPFSVKPDEPVTVAKLTSIMRDYYEGTEFDLTKGLAAGPFGTPDRWATSGSALSAYGITGAEWERSISIFRAAYGWATQARSWLPNEIGGVIWFGPDAPATSIFMPIYCGALKSPESLAKGNTMVFDNTAGWWVCDFIAQYANIKFSYMIKDIKAKQAEIENREYAMQAAYESAALQIYKTNPALARKFITDYTVNNANSVISEYWDFAEWLIVKYNDGYNNIPYAGASLGYPAEWLNAVGFGPTPKTK